MRCSGCIAAFSLYTDAMQVTPRSTHDKPLNLNAIADSVLDGGKLSTDEALFLLELKSSDDLRLLQQVAQEMMRQHTRPVSYPIESRYALILTNRCELKPSIYPYWGLKNEAGYFTLTIDDIDAVLEACRNEHSQKIDGLSITGGGFSSTLQIPGMEKPTVLKTYQALMQYVLEKAPSLHISGFSPDEIDFLSVLSSRSPRYILDLLKDYGLKRLESYQIGILSDSVRQKISPKLTTVKHWFEIASHAHRIGLPIHITSQLGHLENLKQRLQHLERIQTFAQRYPESIYALTPQLLEINPKRQNEWPALVQPADRMKWLAVQRVFLGSEIPNQQSFWQVSAQSPQNEAQEGLTWGASSIGATHSLAYSSFLLGSHPESWLLPQLDWEELSQLQTEALASSRQAN